MIHVLWTKEEIMQKRCKLYQEEKEIGEIAMYYGGFEINIFVLFYSGVTKQMIKESVSLFRKWKEDRKENEFEISVFYQETMEQDVLIEYLQEEFEEEKRISKGSFIDAAGRTIFKGGQIEDVCYYRMHKRLDSKKKNDEIYKICAEVVRMLQMENYMFDWKIKKEYEFEFYYCGTNHTVHMVFEKQYHWLCGNEIYTIETFSIDTFQKVLLQILKKIEQKTRLQELFSKKETRYFFYKLNIWKFPKEVYKALKTCMTNEEIEKKSFQHIRDHGGKVHFIKLENDMYQTKIFDKYILLDKQTYVFIGDKEEQLQQKIQSR